jgi:hypothetical protein
MKCVRRKKREVSLTPPNNSPNWAKTINKKVLMKRKWKMNEMCKKEVNEEVNEGKWKMNEMCKKENRARKKRRIKEK